MKKRLVTYSFFIVLCSGFCNKSFAFKPAVFFAEKDTKTEKFFSSENSLHDKSAKHLNIQVEVTAIALPTIFTCFLGEQIFLLPLDGLRMYKAVSIPETAQLKKNYLLHLFPSHYFW